MKKLKPIALGLLLILSFSFLFTGCGGNNNKNEYKDLKNIIINLQQEDKDNIYNYKTVIIITGTFHSQNDGTEKHGEAGVYLRDVILTDNCILERPREYDTHYWFYFDIEEIKDNDRNVIWTKS